MNTLLYILLFLVPVGMGVVVFLFEYGRVYRLIRSVREGESTVVVKNGIPFVLYKENTVPDDLFTVVEEMTTKGRILSPIIHLTANGTDSIASVVALSREYAMFYISPETIKNFSSQEMKAILANQVGHIAHGTQFWMMILFALRIVVASFVTLALTYLVALIATSLSGGFGIVCSLFFLGFIVWAYLEIQITNRLVENDFGADDIAKKLVSTQWLVSALERTTELFGTQRSKRVRERIRRI